MSLDSIMSETTSLVEAVISKPKMSTKLLSRPPFRFIHDVVMALNDKTHFAEGLFVGDETDSTALKDNKDGRASFLKKTIALVELCTGEKMDIHVSKILAGSEPENTNIFLQRLAQMCVRDDIDFPSKVDTVLGKGGKSSKSKSKSSESKEPERPAEESKQSDKDRKRRGSKQTESTKEQEAKVPEKADRMASESSSKSKKSDRRSSKSRSKAIDFSAVDGEIETTISMYKDLISKPKMSEKLLSKPPFRFLHDVVSALIANTGIMESVLDSREMDSQNVSSKDEKLGYLNKVLSYIETCTDSPCEAKSNKIVAGLEPENTNKMLQKLALIAKNKGQDGGDSAPAEAEPVEVKESRPSAPAETKASEPTRMSAVDDDDEPPPQMGSGRRNHDEVKLEEPTSVIAKPQAARKRPPKLKDNAAQGGSSSKNAPKVAVMMEGEDDSDEESIDETINDLANMRSNAATDDKSGLKSKLVRNLLDNEEKMEQDTQDDKSKEADKKTGIKLGKIGRGVKKTSASATVGGTIEVDVVRGAIQELCQSTNPLGKCMDYVHDDMIVMTKELEKWRAEYQKYSDNWEEEQLTTNETLRPLKSKLSAVEDSIKDEKTKIANIKISIARNDQRIQELLRDMVLS